jgi:murein L,D-transpeptidase YcbB/YkuD
MKAKTNFITRATLLNKANLTVPGSVLIATAIRITSRFLILISILFVGTSYQSRFHEIRMIESESFVPGLVAALQDELSDTCRTCTYALAGEELKMLPLVRKFYEMNNYYPVWTYYRKQVRVTDNLVSMIRNANEYGLEPDNYHAAAIYRVQRDLEDPEKRQDYLVFRTKLELLLTDACMRLMVNLHFGYRAFDSVLFINEWVAGLPQKLTQMHATGELLTGILEAQPEFIEYIYLQRAVSKYVQSVRLTDDWVDVTSPEQDSIAFWENTREVLIRLGYLSREQNGDALLEAFRDFQVHHGLEPSGKPGRNSLEALKQSTRFKYNLLALNLDRLRKLDDNCSQLLFVNIPSYELKVLKNNSLQKTFRVMVGKPGTPTPVLTSQIERVIINPYWHVPRSITMNEILPKIKADSGYLKRNRFKVFDTNNNMVSDDAIRDNNLSGSDFNYTIRQDASSGNALGLVKFVFPNPYSVYLHDTPSKSLFSKDLRAFSHGCIRVQNPELLAEYLVKEVQPETDVMDLIHKGIRREIILAMPIPIEIRYITCGADEKGELYFYKDIYGRDARALDELMAAR